MGNKFIQYIFHYFLAGTGVIFVMVSNITHANFQDKLYCELKEKTITITTKPGNNHLCKNYLLYLKYKVIQENESINKINSLIKQGENKIFRIKIKNKKKENIENIINLARIIQKKTKIFETNMVKNVLFHLKKYLTTDFKRYIKIEKIINKTIDKRKNTSPYQTTQQKKLIHLKEKILTIKKLNQAINYSKSMDDVINNLVKYLYLKKRLTGILES